MASRQTQLTGVAHPGIGLGCCLWVFLALLGADAAIAANGALRSRPWMRVTPAAGVRIRSASSFRALVSASSGISGIDVFQVNADGTSTKLQPILRSADGTYPAAAYRTHDMAAIYWQFGSAPAASSSPPPASVTFINDSPAVPLSGLYYGRLPQTPFAANDATLLLNLDLRHGPPPGWTNHGSGTFDVLDGYRPGIGNGNGVVNSATPALSNSGHMPSGTIAVRLQRVGVTTDDSFPNYFWDSIGNTRNATTRGRQLFEMRSNSGKSFLGAAIIAANVPFLQISLQTESMTRPHTFTWQTVNSHYVPGLQNPNFADLMVTWYQNQYYIFFDGHLISAGTLGDIPTYQMLENICIGNDNGSGVPSGAPFGDYSIQQVQVSSRFLGPVMAGPTVGLMGDSFVAGYTLRATPAGTGAGGTYQISDIDAVQNSMDLYGGLTALGGQSGQTAVFHQIQAVMFERYGFIPPIYNAGQPGHGYSHINLPIDDAYIAALNQAAPAVVVAQGSINDVSPFKPSDANLVADTKSFMNRLVSGGGSRIVAAPNRSLESIIYLEMLSSQGIPSGGGYPEPAYADESQRLIDITRTGLSNFSPTESIGFRYVASRAWWNESSAYATYLYGTNPSNRYNRPGGRDFQNGHPDPAGYSIIAAHLYPCVADAIMTPTRRDLSMRDGF